MTAAADRRWFEAVASIECCVLCGQHGVQVAHSNRDSPAKVRQMFPHKTIEPHFDEGKHCYWLALGKRGEAKAARLGLTHNAKLTCGQQPAKE